MALVRAVGEYRRWLGKLDADGLTVRRHPEYGVAEIVPRRPAVRVQRLREHMFASVGFSVLRRVVHDFGDGVLRKAWHVRGRPDVTAADIRAVYRDAVTSTEGYGYPGDSPIEHPVTQPSKPPDPPPQPPGTTLVDGDLIPW